MVAVEEADRLPATWRPAPTDEEALETKPVKVVRPNTLAVPEALILPLESILKRPRLLVVLVAILN